MVSESALCKEQVGLFEPRKKVVSLELSEGGEWRLELVARTGLEVPSVRARILDFILHPLGVLGGFCTGE